MAKKAAKKEVPAAKAKKAAKPEKKAALKPESKAPTKAATKPKPITEKAKVTIKSTEKAPVAKAKKPVAEKKSAVKPAPVVEVKAKLAPAETKAKKAPEAAAAAKEVEAPKAKKEKKLKLDKTGLSEDQVKWHEYHEKHKDEKAPAYSISGQFEAKKPIQHKLFGWGYVLSNEYDRLEILFEDGKRMLISNRKL